MKIAFVARGNLSNNMYRAMVPARALERRGHQVDVFIQFRGEPKISLDELARYDVVYAYRVIINEDLDYVAKLHDAGVAVCFDNDDDVPSITSEMWEQMRQAYGTEDGLIDLITREHSAALALVPQVDLVTSPSRSIAQRYEALGARNVEVVPNSLPAGISATRPASYEGFTIGWHACNEHVWDVRALRLEERLNEVLQAHPDVNVVTVGIELDLDPRRYRRIAHVPLPDLFNRIAGFDIGIAPLANLPFNDGRSDVKLREYAAAGVPWVASAVGPYLGHGDEEGGQLVEDDEWFDALDALIRSPRELGKRRKKARKWAKREHMDHMADLWEGLLAGVVETRAAA